MRVVQALEIIKFSGAWLCHASSCTHQHATYPQPSLAQEEQTRYAIAMAIDQALLALARRNPAGLPFGEALTLARQLGFQHVRTQGSHFIFHHPLAPRIRDRFPQPLNLQCGKDGKAKSYQIRQLIQMAEAMGVIPPA
jgi:hypothetical protein